MVNDGQSWCLNRVDDMADIMVDDMVNDDGELMIIWWLTYGKWRLTVVSIVWLNISSDMVNRMVKRGWGKLLQRSTIWPWTCAKEGNWSEDEHRANGRPSRRWKTGWRGERNFLEHFSDVARVWTGAGQWGCWWCWWCSNMATVWYGHIRRGKYFYPQLLFLNSCNYISLQWQDWTRRPRRERKENIFQEQSIFQCRPAAGARSKVVLICAT